MKRIGYVARAIFLVASLLTAMQSWVTKQAMKRAARDLGEKFP